MRKIMLAALGAAVLSAGATMAQAQERGHEPGNGHHSIFESDTNNDDALTRAEFDAGRDALFARLDADNNGQLSHEEMRAHHRRGGHRRGHHGGPPDILAHADSDNDGNITRDEFLARPIEMFARLDSNHDGVISATERPRRPEPGAEGGPPPPQPDHPNPDADGNGAISRAEFATMSAGMFAHLDANDDGRVTREEAREAHGRHRGRDRD